MNCKKCFVVLYYGQKICKCGEKVPVLAPPPRKQADREYPPNAVSKAFGLRLTEVNDYVDAYRQKNPNSSKRSACLSFLQERGIALPGYLSAQKENDEEARLERQAIQND